MTHDPWIVINHHSIKHQFFPFVRNVLHYSYLNLHLIIYIGIKWRLYKTIKENPNVQFVVSIVQNAIGCLLFSYLWKSTRDFPLRSPARGWNWVRVAGRHKLIGCCIETPCLSVVIACMGSFRHLAFPAENLPEFIICPQKFWVPLHVKMIILWYRVRRASSRKSWIIRKEEVTSLSHLAIFTFPWSIPFYLVTPNGSIQHYDNSAGEIRIFEENVNKYLCDPNDPYKIIDIKKYYGKE